MYTDVQVLYRFTMDVQWCTMGKHEVSYYLVLSLDTLRRDERFPLHPEVPAAVLAETLVTQENLVEECNLKIASLGPLLV